MYQRSWVRTKRMTRDYHAMQKGERRKGKPTTMTDLPEYPYGAILAAGESKDPMDAAENVRYHCELNHGPEPLALLASRDAVSL
jgi:hypothetical protein